MARWCKVCMYQYWIYFRKFKKNKHFQKLGVSSNRLKRHVVCFCVLGMLCGLLTGCSTQELEERYFPMAVVVGYEDNKVFYQAAYPKQSSGSDSKITEIKTNPAEESNFGKSKQVYESRLNKIPDYNHLKVLVLEEDFLEMPEAYKNMLENLAESEDYPRNTVVCAIDDAEELLEIAENLPQDLGSYLEEYLNHHEEKKNRLLTLGDLMDENENQEMVLYVPFLDVEESYVEWNGYYAIGKNLPAVDMK